MRRGNRNRTIECCLKKLIETLHRQFLLRKKEVELAEAGGKGIESSQMRELRKMKQEQKQNKKKL